MYQLLRNNNKKKKLIGGMRYATHPLITPLIVITIKDLYKSYNIGRCIDEF